MAEVVLGISALYHDSAAALLYKGEIVAAAQEERFTRKKNDSSFPKHAVGYVLDQAGIDLSEVSYVAFYDKPFLKFERLLETYHACVPQGLPGFLKAMPVWIKEKLFLKRLLKQELSCFGRTDAQILFPNHHLSHAASAFFPSPFQEAAILTLDGVGEWATTTIGFGRDSDITILRELQFPHSLGLLYSSFTSYCGFRVNSGEYKLMGLAPFGDPGSPETREFIRKIKGELIDLRDDGSFLLNRQYFSFISGLTMCNEAEWEKLFGLTKRQMESKIEQSYMNLAYAIQVVTEEILIELAKTAMKLTKSKYIVLAGGVALNCVATSKLLRSALFNDVWIQPASGDAGGALGAAYAAYYIGTKKHRRIIPGHDSMKGAFLGPRFLDSDIDKVIRKFDAPCKHYETFDALATDVAQLIHTSAVIGWFQDRMEFGPRALGNRSILANACDPLMQKKLNLKIKFREGFRPFAPACLEEMIPDYFEFDKPSPYMLFIAYVNKNRRAILPDDYATHDLYKRLYFMRSDLPAITHIDFSARLQSVAQKTNPRFWTLIHEYRKLSTYGILINTSFNVRGEPIVCTPQDAYLCFMKTEMDYLVIEQYVFDKREQKKLDFQQYDQKKYLD